jgi:hypothetical protein
VIGFFAILSFLFGIGQNGPLRFERKTGFCVSIFLTRIDGDTVETGTDPDSAPQIPENTSFSLPASRISEKLVSGVSYEVNPFNKFIGATICINLINLYRENIKIIRRIDHCIG